MGQPKDPLTTPTFGPCLLPLPRRTVDCIVTGAEVSGSVYDAVVARLRDDRAPLAVLDLWIEIEREFRNGGPDAVKALLDRKARALSRAAEKDLKATRAVATAVGPTRRKSPSAGPRRSAPTRR